jgi:cobalt/nickel transport system permease protein
LILRVTDSLSLGALLILTTPWTKLLATFRWFRVPSLFVSVLSMTYRYIFVLLHTVNNMFLARKSRTPGTLSAKQNRKWLGHTLAATMLKSLHISEQVYSAMLSRGYRDDGLTISQFKLRQRDLLWLLFASAALTLPVWAG